MQTLIFVRRSHGTSKKGQNYDLSEVSNGIASFTLTNHKDVVSKLEQLTEGESFDAEVHVSTQFGSLRGTIVDVA